MAKLIQYQLYGEQPEIVATSKGVYNDFLAKFGRKKTTDECYTPELVYKAVFNWLGNVLLQHCSVILPAFNIVRPFYPNMDYLTYNYSDNDLVLDNPPFSLYSKIVRNYMRMNVKFFLFGPALSLFVPDSGASYVITGANITYANGAKVRTSFVTNILPYKILISHGLQQAIHAAQRTKPAEIYRPEMPAQYWSSAQLLRFANNPDFNFKPLTATEDFIKFDKLGKKIFGAAIRISDTDNEILNNI
jgi:hypothetical protein